MRNETDASGLMPRAFDAYFDRSPDLLFVKDSNSVYRTVSRSLAEALGFSTRGELVGKTDYDLFDGPLAKKYEENDRAILKSGRALVNYSEEVTFPDGVLRRTTTSKYPIIGEDGTTIGIFGISRDTTGVVAMEEAGQLHEISTQLFDAVVEGDLGRDAVVFLDASAWEDRGACGVESSYSRLVARISDGRVHPDDREVFLSRFIVSGLREQYARGVREFSATLRMRRDGAYVWAEITTRLYPSRADGTLRMAAFLRDVDKNVRDQEELRRRAHTDPLTGLLNRDSFEGLVTEALNKSAHGHSALLFIDMDDFKQINDSYGHPRGDQVLRQVAQHLRCCFRGTDLVGRIGGDEFLVLMRGPVSQQSIIEKAREASRALAECSAAMGMAFSCSIGAAVSRPGYGFEDLYKIADDAMYAAKRGGKRSLCLDGRVFSLE